MVLTDNDPELELNVKIISRKNETSDMGRDYQMADLSADVPPKAHQQVSSRSWAHSGFADPQVQLVTDCVK